MLRKMRSYLHGKMVDYLAERFVTIVSFQDDRAEIFNKVVELRKSQKIFIKINEGIQLYNLVQSANKIKGDIAEIGVFKGGSAKLINIASKKHLHLFDTFEGLPELSKEDGLNFYKGKHKAGLDEVKSFLGENNISYYKGLISETSKEVNKNIRFSFVHLDVDLYQSTLDLVWVTLNPYLHNSN